VGNADDISALEKAWHTLLQSTPHAALLDTRIDVRGIMIE